MDCTNNYIQLKDHLKAMVRSSGQLSGMAIVEVESGYEDPAPCDDGLPRSFEQRLAASIGVDPCGKPALRVKFIDSCTSKISCTVGAEENVLDNIFAYESSTKSFALILNKST